MIEKARYNSNVARCTDGKGYLHGRKLELKRGGEYYL